MCWRKLAIDKIPGKIDRIAYIFELIAVNNDFSCAVSQLSYIAGKSKYGSEIPTTVEAIERYAIDVTDKVYRRVVGKQASVFPDISDNEIKGKFYPSIKELIGKAESKKVKTSRTIGLVRVDPFIAELYGITPGSKIILSSENSPAPIGPHAAIDKRLDPLSIGLHPEDAKCLFGWNKVPDEFRQNRYRGKYNIERVELPQAPVLHAPEKTPFEIRLEGALKESYRELGSAHHVSRV
jgi:hypothetical protein